MEIPTNVFEALRNYAEFHKVEFDSKKISKVLTTLKLYVIPYSTFSDTEAFTLETKLKQIALEHFVQEAEQVFNTNYQLIIASQPDRKGTLDNDRSNLVGRNGFLTWMKQQVWYNSLLPKPELTTKENSYSFFPEYAPRKGTGPSLQVIRKGLGRSYIDNQYRLPKELIPTLLADELQKIAKFALATSTDDLPKKDQPIRMTTLEGYQDRLRSFLGWLIKYEATAFAIRLLDLQEQKIDLAKEDSRLSMEIFTRDPSQLELHALRDFAVASKTAVRIKLYELKIDMALFNLAPSLMYDEVLLRKFINWGVNEQGNSWTWVKGICTTALLLAQYYSFEESKQTDYEEMEIIKTIKRIRKPYKKYKSKVRETKNDKYLTTQETELLLEFLWRCTADKDYRGRHRSVRDIIQDKKRYLIFLILHHYPIRSREIREMRIGNQLSWGYMDDGRQAYFCAMDESDTKTGSPKKWFLDPEVFNKPIKDWLEVWRPKAGVNHDFVFFTDIGNSHPENAGERFNESVFSRFVTNSTYNACRDLKWEAEQAFFRLKQQGLSEEEAESALLEQHRIFLKINLKRTNPHFFRHIATTEIRKPGVNAAHAELKAFHEIIGNSVATGDATYEMLTPEEKTAAAVEWREKVKLVKSSVSNQHSLGSVISDILTLPPAALEKLKQILLGMS